jgi:methylenetetrahydrofolate reductase (NADPH)
LTGAHQSLGTSPKAAGAYDLDATQLSLALSRMADDGLDFSGKKLDKAPDLFIAASAHPYLRPMDLNLLGLKKKVTAGAQAVLTDAITDFAGLEQWMQAVRAAGIDKKAAIIVSVRPENVDIARKVRGVAGVRGIHLLSGGSEHLVAQVIKEASLA